MFNQYFPSSQQYYVPGPSQAYAYWPQQDQTPGASTSTAPNPVAPARRQKTPPADSLASMDNAAFWNRFAGEYVDVSDAPDEAILPWSPPSLPPRAHAHGARAGSGSGVAQLCDTLRRGLARPYTTRRANDSARSNALSVVTPHEIMPQPDPLLTPEEFILDVDVETWFRADVDVPCYDWALDPGAYGQIDLTFMSPDPRQVYLDAAASYARYVSPSQSRSPSAPSSSPTALFSDASTASSVTTHSSQSASAFPPVSPSSPSPVSPPSPCPPHAPAPTHARAYTGGKSPRRTITRVHPPSARRASRSLTPLSSPTPSPPPPAIRAPAPTAPATRRAAPVQRNATPGPSGTSSGSSRNATPGPSDLSATVPYAGGKARRTVSHRHHSRSSPMAYDDLSDADAEGEEDWGVKKGRGADGENADEEWKAGADEGDNDDDDDFKPSGAGGRKSKAKAKARKGKTKARKGKAKAKPRAASRQPTTATFSPASGLKPILGEDGIYHCPAEGCKRTANSKGDMQRHLQSSVHVEAAWWCRCGKPFQRDDSMLRHCRGRACRTGTHSGCNGCQH